MQSFLGDIVLLVSVVIEAGNLTPVVRWKTVFGRLNVVFELIDKAGYSSAFDIYFSADPCVGPIYPRESDIRHFFVRWGIH